MHAEIHRHNINRTDKPASPCMGAVLMKNRRHSTHLEWVCPSTMATRHCTEWQGTSTCAAPTTSRTHMTSVVRQNGDTRIRSPVRLSTHRALRHANIHGTQVSCERLGVNQTIATDPRVFDVERRCVVPALSVAHCIASRHFPHAHAYTHTNTPSTTALAAAAPAAAVAPAPAPQRKRTTNTR